MIITIDSRESSLFSLISERDLDIYKDKITICQKTLEIGDICIQIGETIMLFERKTISDMIASIKDGRFREQKSRMESSGHIISYIVEGGYIITADETLSGAYLNTIYRDHMPILFVKNIADTATLILTIGIKLLKDEHRFDRRTINNYLDTLRVKSKKSDNIDVRVCFELQLCQIPGISKIIAETLSKEHRNIYEFTKKISEMSLEDKIKYLTSFHNIGKKKAQKIIEYLF